MFDIRPVQLVSSVTSCEEPKGFSPIKGWKQWPVISASRPLIRLLNGSADWNNLEWPERCFKVKEPFPIYATRSQLLNWTCQQISHVQAIVNSATYSQQQRYVIFDLTRPRRVTTGNHSKCHEVIELIHALSTCACMCVFWLGRMCTCILTSAYVCMPEGVNFCVYLAILWRPSFMDALKFKNDS